MKKRVFGLTAALLAAGALSASAQETCGGTYKVKRGDSLSLIADRLYRDVGKWSVIYRSNTDKIASPDAIRVGQTYRVPCIDGLPVGLPGGTPIADTVNVTASVKPAKVVPKATPVAELQRAAQIRKAGVDVKLLAGDDFRPFTNRLQMSSGLITDLVNRAFIADDQFGLHQFYWINDRAVHLDPMLSEGMVDLAFPWKKPDCSASPDTKLCTDYLYSDPMFEMLVVLFTRRGGNVTYTGEADLADMRVCTPRGHGSGGHGAAYLTRVGARLQQPATAESCFDRLASGSVDAVAMNEFTGRVVLKDMGLDDVVELQLSRPLAIEGLHAVAHRNNPRAAQLIGAFNAGLAETRETGEYLKVIDTHMSSIWAGL